MEKYYAKLDKNGEITTMYYGLQEDKTFVEVDFSSELYKTFYESMPVAIGLSLPDPV
ncbi:hypothetical protein ACLIXB_003601 [Yersinia enterocolitica]|uniref:hypothetical protein n=1 Tax=Yersinia enterocolitica TaxID=630 RepID=UPI0005E77CA0|nr:hypothetical protein [Yersinia enterocolitica]ELI8049663.1 hypothetical protein [Yersinia enterocolitica]ELI8122614.1 hypothetical protein [Yersinia enterocolitica]ELI8400374.1 hypothetical protein [Yersinia enterocolitica]ELY5203271.1 hypothetical protein [Yersinia enterocolitica]ELZ4048871.1 hypothetical protein [Yersinia enterocolitica]